MSFSGDVFEPISISNGEAKTARILVTMCRSDSLKYTFFFFFCVCVCVYAAKQRAGLIEWLDCLLPNLNFPINASDQELRSLLVDGTVMCQILNKLKPGSVTEVVHHDCSPKFVFLE